MNQSGYALLLSLFVMFSAGSIWIAGSGAQRMSNNRYETLELERARDALIGYAVNYIDHYGVQGAGIGHLPCPDTDTPDLSHSDPWVRDGPNPPCAKDIELGWLPRHVSTAGGRYHFHDRSRQRVWYAVSGKFINNPLNRVVNPSTVGDISIGSFNDVVAVLTVPNLEVEHKLPQPWWLGDATESVRAAYSVIRTSDIRIPAMRRVAVWMLEHLNTAIGPPPCHLEAELNLLHWMSEKSVNPDCAAHKKQLLSEFAFVEGAPYARHWFVRNKWFDYLKIELESTCLSTGAPPCEFVVEPTKVFDEFITLRLLLSDTVS